MINKQYNSEVVYEPSEYDKGYQSRLNGEEQPTDDKSDDFHAGWMDADGNLEYIKNN